LQNIQHNVDDDGDKKDMPFEINDGGVDKKVKADKALLNVTSGSG
jgi:hypothetical protein